MPLLCAELACTAPVRRRGATTGSLSIAAKERLVDLERYTDRARRLIQSAQALALRYGHQQFSPEHLLKTLLDDPEGLASGLLERAGGDVRKIVSATDRALSQKAAAGKPGQIFLDPTTSVMFEAAESRDRKSVV